MCDLVYPWEKKKSELKTWFQRYDGETSFA